MTKSDLEIFDVVKLRDGRLFMVLPNNLSPDGLGIFSLEAGGCHEYMTDYTDDLTCSDGTNSDDIIAVYKSKGREYSVIRDLFVDKSFERARKWTWERREPKEMTMEELEKVLGYPVKIVKEKEQ